MNKENFLERNMDTLNGLKEVILAKCVYQMKENNTYDEPSACTDFSLEWCFVIDYEMKQRNPSKEIVLSPCI